MNNKTIEISTVILIIGMVSPLVALRGQRGGGQVTVKPRGPIGGVHCSEWVKRVVAQGVGQNGIATLAIGKRWDETQNRLYCARPDRSLMEYTYNSINETWDASTVFTNSEVRDILVGEGKNDGKKRIYTCEWDYIKETSWEGGTWVRRTVGQVPNQVFFHVTVGPGRNDATNRVYASCEDGNLHEYTWNGSTWLSAAIPNLQGAAVGAGRNDGFNRLYATGWEPTNRHAYELTWNGSAWQTADMGEWWSADQFGEIPSNSPVTIANGRDDGVLRIFFPTESDREYEYTWDTETQTWFRGIMNDAGPPEYRFFKLEFGRVAGDGKMAGYCGGQSGLVGPGEAPNDTAYVWEFRMRVLPGWLPWQWDKIARVGKGECGVIVGNGRNDGKERVYAIGIDGTVYEISCGQG